MDVTTVIEDSFDDPTLDSPAMWNALLELPQHSPDCIVLELAKREHNTFEGPAKPLKSSSWATFRSISMPPDAVVFSLTGE
jgi:hypothetical protein